MLAFAIVKEIRRLLAEGNLSQRKIAQKLGVSRNSVSQIFHGKQRCVQSRATLSFAPLEPTGPAQRCGTCGGMVYMPCWLCHIRTLSAQERSRSAADAVELLKPGVDWPLPEVECDPPDDLALRLEEAERVRYEEIRLQPEPMEEVQGEGPASMPRPRRGFPT